MSLRSTIRDTALGGLRVAAGAVGQDLVERHFYNPLPGVAELSEERWRGPLELPGVDLRIEAATKLLRKKLWPYLEEFRPPIDPDGSDGFVIRNGSYESVDAELLYAVVRYLKPKLILELGSGATSHVIQAAAHSNREEGHTLEHEIFDPYPFAANPMGAVAGPQVHRQRAEDTSTNEIARLQSGDILFVDTTHTVKTGGDVTRIFLDFLPLLDSGVWIHVHDIFLPYEYPRQWVIDERRAWAEQYLLQAFLALNHAFEVMLPAHAIMRAEPDLISEVIASYTEGVSPGAFWMRRL